MGNLGIVESLRLHAYDNCGGKDVPTHVANQAAGEIERLRKELDYAYRCITGGYNQGVFDFSVLKNRALAHLAIEASKELE